MNDEEMPLLLYPFPAAILHVDADAFFASVEQAVHPSLKGRPVVTGKERGIIASASYEAKSRGVRRGLSLREARLQCPELVVLPSDYETYSLYSRRMFDVFRRFTPMVEESSIDEAYADLTGLRRVFRASYEAIAFRLKEEVKRDLGITVSVGLSVTKMLAKLASDRRKPDGLMVVPGTRIHEFLRDIPVGDVCGIGPHAVRLLQKYGVATATDFVRRPEAWVSRLLGKPGREIWNELRGRPVYEVRTSEPPPAASISKGKTFSVPSADPEYLYARLTRNVESAFIKLRRHRLRTAAIGILLRRQTFEEEGVEARLSRATASTLEAVPVVRRLFDEVVRPGVEYRSTLVFLTRLEGDAADQLELFENRPRIERMRRISRAMDEVNARYGKHSVALGTGLFLQRAVRTAREEPPERKRRLLPGETPRRRLSIPRLMLTV